MCKFRTILSLTSYRYSKDTPLPTPTHKFNAWAKDRKSLGVTPAAKQENKEGKEGEEGKMDDAERQEWEEDQKVMMEGKEVCKG